MSKAQGRALNAPPELSPSSRSKLSASPANLVNGMMQKVPQDVINARPRATALDEVTVARVALEELAQNVLLDGIP